MENPSKKKQVFCVKLKREAEALPAPPFPTPLGLRIFENVSKAGWEGWIAHQTMLVNENRLSLSEASARTYLKEQMEQYFFGSGSDIPAGYTPTSLRKPTG